MIEGNLGMPIMASDLNTSAYGSLAGSGSDSLGSAEESIFQKMVSQALASNGAVVKTVADKASAGTESAVLSGQGTTEAGSINDLLTKLLLGTINPESLKSQAVGNGSSGKDEAEGTTEEDSTSMALLDDTLAAMQAILGGQNGAFLVRNNGTENAEAAADTTTLAAVVGLVQSKGNNLNGFINSNRNSIDQELFNGQAESAGSLGQTTVLTEADAGNTGTAGIVAATGTFDEAAMLKNNGNQEIAPIVGTLAAANAGQVSQSTEVQQETSQSSFQIPAAERTNQVDAGESESIQKSIAALSENSKIQTDDDVSESLNAAAYQSQSQSTGTVDTATQVNQPIQTAAQPEAYSQISSEILEKLNQKGPTEFTMQLQPENLGKIDISLKLSDGNLVINIMAENAKTQALLTGQVDKLISSMGLQNAQVQSIQVNQQMNSDSQNSQNQAYQGNSAMDFSQGRQNSQQTAESWQQFNSRMYGMPSDAAVEKVSSAQQMRDNFTKMDYAV